MRALALLTVLAFTAAGAAPAGAEEPEAPASRQELEERIAGLLYERGVKLFEAELWSDAMALFQESLARSPNGPRAAAARDMIRRCEEALAEPADADPQPAGDDPSMSPSGDDVPLDPYADEAPRKRRRITPSPRRKWLPPVMVAAGPTRDRLSPEQKRRNLVYIFGGGYGAIVTSYLASAITGEDVVAVPAAMAGAVVGITGSWLITRGRTIKEGDASLVMSATIWVGYLAAAVTHMIDDPKLCAECIAGAEDMPEAAYPASVAIASVAALAGGIVLARRYDPSPADVALTNSFVAYGAGTGLFAGVIMQPSQTRAYTFNVVIGAGVGLGAGLYLARRADISRGRTLVMDGAALAGALAGYYVVGGLIDRDDASNTDEWIRGAAGALGIATGAFLAWYYTRGTPALPRAEVKDPAPPALVTRAGDGRWQWGGLAPTAYGTVDGGAALGVSLVSGRF